MEYKLLNGLITGAQNENGNWIYKSNNIPFKKNGSLKKEYKDLPRFKAIVQYEKAEMEDYNKGLKEAVQDISLKLLSFSR